MPHSHPCSSGSLRGQQGHGGERGARCSVLAQHLSSPAKDGDTRQRRLQDGM